MHLKDVSDMSLTAKPQFTLFSAVADNCLGLDGAMITSS